MAECLFALLHWGVGERRLLEDRLWLLVGFLLWLSRSNGVVDKILIYFLLSGRLDLLISESEQVFELLDIVIFFNLDDFSVFAHVDSVFEPRFVGRASSTYLLSGCIVLTRLHVVWILIAK